VFFSSFAACVQPAAAQLEGASPHGKPIEMDSESGAEVDMLGRDERPADKNDGEQPYGESASAARPTQASNGATRTCT